MKETTKITPSLKSQGAWLMLGRSVGIVFSFLLPIIVYRYLSESDIGVYRQSFQVVMNAVTILSLGFAMSAYYYLSRDPKQRNSAVLNILLFHFVMGGLACGLLVFKPSVLGWVFQSTEMERLAPLIGIAVWIWLFSLFLETAAVANREPKPAAFFIIFAQATKTFILVVVAIIYGSPEAILYAAIVQGVIQTIVLLIYLSSRFTGFWSSFDFSFFKEHFAYAVPFGAAATLSILQTNIHLYFVGHRFSEAEFAIYATGCAQLPFAVILVDSIGSVLIPKMSELQLMNDREEMIRLSARAMQKLAFFFFPIFVFLFLTAQTFITALFTRNFVESVPIFLVNITLFPFFVLMSDPVIRAYKDLGKKILAVRIVIFVLMLGALFYAMQNLGLLGIIVVAVSSIALEIVISEAIIFKRLGVQIKDFRRIVPVGKTAIISLLAGLVMFAFYYFIREWTPDIVESVVKLFVETPKDGWIDFISGSITLGISALIFSPIYLAVSSRFGLIDKDDKEKINSILVRLGLLKQTPSLT